MIDLEPIRSLTDPLPPGPWISVVDLKEPHDADRLIPDYWTWEVGVRSTNESLLGGADTNDPRPIVEFLCAARTAVPSLIAEVERLRALLEATRLNAVEAGNPGIDMAAVRQGRVDL